MKLPVCTSCKSIQYPVREICRNCLSEDITWQDIDPQATLLVSVPLHHSHEEQFDLPTTIGTVQLKDGTTLISHIDGDLKPGTPVTLKSITDHAGRTVFTASAGDN